MLEKQEIQVGELISLCQFQVPQINGGLIFQVGKFIGIIIIRHTDYNRSPNRGGLYTLCQLSGKGIEILSPYPKPARRECVPKPAE